MKLATAILLLAAPLARAGLIIATVDTNLGDITIQLDYLHSPKTVANFMRLATGNMPWIDESTGIVQFNRPFYNGLTFHKVTSGIRSETGSRNGIGNDGPGYTFPDETDNGLSHDAAYVVSMSNSGPNTNGSRFFITAAAQTHLDGKHTVFGLVADTESQAVCDAINTTATDGAGRPIVPVVINSIDIFKINTSFDPNAQGIPDVTAPPTEVAIFNSTNVFLHFIQPNRSLAQVFYSPDCKNWNSTRRYRDPEDGPLFPLFDMRPQTAGQSRSFFAASVVLYAADAVFPDTIAERTLRATHVGAPVSTTITYVFNSKGGGTYSSKTLGGGTSGDITSYDYIPDGYGAWLTIHTSGLPSLSYRLGYDAKNPDELWGRHTGISHTRPGPTPFSGNFKLTR
jgi:peptidyl-prolyl cis-trans isomerase A (cyclophilin A)